MKEEDNIRDVLIALLTVGDIILFEKRVGDDTLSDTAKVTHIDEKYIYFQQMPHYPFQYTKRKWIIVNHEEKLLIIKWEWWHEKT